MRNGETALHYAARGGNTEIVKILLISGCDKTIKGIHGTALDVAQTSGSSDNVTLLKMFRVDMAKNQGTSEEDSENRNRGKSRLNQINGVDPRFIFPELLTPGNQRKILTKKEYVADSWKLNSEEIRQQHVIDFQLPKNEQFVYET